MSEDILLMEYKNAINTPSDINEHLEFLKTLCTEVNHVTEMGSRRGTSTRAFLSSNVSLRAYDLDIDNRLMELFNIAKDQGKDVEYIQANVLNIEIDPTDLLFIDTWHCYEQLREELRIHAHKVRKYIAFHDTQSYGTQSEVMNGMIGSNGLLPAIIHYMIDNPGIWRFKYHRTNNNGLTVIERVSYYYT